MRRAAVVQRWREIAKLPAQLLARTPNKAVVLLAGSQRSGTNMMMGALDRHPLTTVFHEFDQRAFENYCLRPESQLVRIVRRAHGRRVIFKALMDIQNYRTYGHVFEAATGQPMRIVWPVRRYEDVINSQLKRWPESREEVDEILGDGVIKTWRGAGLGESTMERLRVLYRRDLSNADCKGIAWLMRNELVFNEDFPRDRCVFVSYEQLVRDPAEQLGKLCEALSLPRDNRMTEGIHTRSISKTSPPHLSPHVAEACRAMQDSLMELVAP